MSTGTQPQPTPLPEVSPGRGPAETGPVVRIRGLSHWFGTGEARKQVLYENNLGSWFIRLKRTLPRGGP